MKARIVLADNPGAGLRIYATLCAIGVGAIFLTNWPTYHYAVWGGPVPLVYYFIPGVCIVPIAFAAPSSAVRFLREPLFWWFAAYVLSGLVWLLPAQDFIEDASQQWRLRVVAFFFFYTMTMLVSDSKRPVVALVMIGCLVLACIANWIDVLRPFQLVPRGVEIEGRANGRGAGLFLNPNGAAEFVVMCAIAVLPFTPMRLRGMVILCALAGVAPTFSRSGYLYVAVLVVGAIVLRLLNRAQTVFILVSIPLLFALTAASYDFLLSSSDDKNLDEVVQRLRWFDTMEQDEAIAGRADGARRAWDMFLDDPLTGKGVGATSLEVLGDGPHNMYLLLMAEQGFVGLLLYLTLIGIVAQRGWRLARMALTSESRDIGNAIVVLAGFLVVCGFFSHNVLQGPWELFILSFLIAAGLHAPRAAAAAASLIRFQDRPGSLKVARESSAARSWKGEVG